MNHYDGPAFYRKYRDFITKKPTSAAASQSTSTAPRPASAGLSAATSAAKPVYSTGATVQSAASQPTSTEPFNGVTHGDFHPTHIPAQLTRSNVAVGVTVTHDETAYLEVEASLHKPIETYFLFADEASTSEPIVELSAAPVAETNYPATEITSEAAPTVVFEPATSVTSVATTMATSTAPTEVFEPTSLVSASMAASDSAVTSMVNSAESVTPPTSETSTESTILSTEAETTTIESAEITSSADSAAVSAATQLADLAETADSESPSSAPISTAAKPNHGLGLSLDAIMTEEHNAQSDLALFKDQPEAETAETPVSEQSMGTDDAGDDEMYQPVGVRPRAQPAVKPASSATKVTSQAPIAASAASATSADAEPTSAVHSGTSAAPVLADKDLAAYHLPPLDLLKAPVVPDESEMDDWIESKASALDESLDAFGVDANVVDWTVGPTVTQFQVKLARGVKVSKITNLNDDLKLALAAKDIRIEAPIPGRNTVGIEIPNKKSRPVMLSEVLNSQKFKDSRSPLTVALGVDLFGQPQVTDLRKMPHGLIAGATGSGKSVFINSILVPLL